MRPDDWTPRMPLLMIWERLGKHSNKISKMLSEGFSNTTDWPNLRSWESETWDVIISKRSSGNNQEEGMTIMRPGFHFPQKCLSAFVLQIH